MTKDDFSHEMDIELDPQIAEGEYANLVIISHSPSEFVLDFAGILPGLPKPKVRSRIILAPEHAKRLLLTLQENISNYEAVNGHISLSPTPAEEAKMAMSLRPGEA